MQPIIDSCDGTIFAYEALICSFMPILMSLMEEGCLDEIETLTWFGTLNVYDIHIKNNLVSTQTKIFINSLSNQMLSKEAMLSLESKYQRYLKILF